MKRRGRRRRRRPLESVLGMSWFSSSPSVLFLKEEFVTLCKLYLTLIIQVYQSTRTWKLWKIGFILAYTFHKMWVLQERLIIHWQYHCCLQFPQSGLGKVSWYILSTEMKENTTLKTRTGIFCVITWQSGLAVIEGEAIFNLIRNVCTSEKILVIRTVLITWCVQIYHVLIL